MSLITRISFLIWKWSVERHGGYVFQSNDFKSYMLAVSRAEAVELASRILEEEKRR